MNENEALRDIIGCIITGIVIIVALNLLSSCNRASGENRTKIELERLKAGCK